MPSGTVPAVTFSFPDHPRSVQQRARASGIRPISGQTAAARRAPRRPSEVVAASGLFPAAFGVVLLAQLRRRRHLLALLFGLFSLVYGVSQIVLGVPLRQTGRSVMEQHAA
jgi:hypothetical protein